MRGNLACCVPRGLLPGNWGRLLDFLERLRVNAETLDILERQKIVRLLVREVLVDDNSVTIRHSIPLKRSPMRAETSNPSTTPHKGGNANSNQLLCSDRIASAGGEAP
jgi:site-specific DNA recombinase